MNFEKCFFYIYGDRVLFFGLYSVNVVNYINLFLNVKSTAFLE